nr:unnamed protein product [Ananas comosus var. bracteatus]
MSKLLFLFLFLFLFSFTSTQLLKLVHGSSPSPSTFVYAGCSPSKFQPNTPFEANLDSLLTSIATTASEVTYNSFSSSAAAADSAVYGLYQCRGDLAGDDCAACVRSAVAQLSLVCSYALAASLQLDGCFVRYASTNFLGQQDTSLAYRKCSTSTSNDEEFLRRRDDVLADLQSGVVFRVSSSGSVQGYAQCVGDLGTADCSACLAQAVGQLKNSCGSAMAADVYLAQCYARYWASGYYFHPSGDSEDDIGRTVAIIVGILAGLALIVVFISFLKRAC